MNLTSPVQIRELLAQLEFRPSRGLGQNFLIDRNILDLIVDAAELTSDDCVLEIGPGLGVLTEAMLERAGRVMAIEKDRRLAAYLRERFGSDSRLSLQHADAVKCDFEDVLSAGVTRVVSNLPYSVGSRILVDIFDAANRPDLIVVTLQREVVERLCAAPGTKEYGLLSIRCQVVYEPELVKVVRRTCFFPRPDVDSAVVRMRRREESLVDEAHRALFVSLVSAAFQHRRKQLRTILARESSRFDLDTERIDALLDGVGCAPDARPENLSPAQWCELAVLVDR